MSRISILLDAIARPNCIECGVPLQSGSIPLCQSCDRRLPWWREVDGCPRCGTPHTMASDGLCDHDERVFEGCAGCLAEGSALHGCRSLLRYEGSVRRWIPGFKTARGPFGPAIAIRLAIDHLAYELARRVLEESSARPDCIVSIPLHPRRKRWRRFNHVDSIASRIARNLGRPWASDALVRIHQTRDQAKLVGRDRRENVRGAFRVTRRLATATHIWLVDDVLTTGNTLDAAANALLDGGASEVRALTLAATLPRRRARRQSDVYHAGPGIDRTNSRHRFR